MITFRDMTYCAADDCSVTACPRHRESEKRDRERIPWLVELPTAWADFRGSCAEYAKQFRAKPLKLFEGKTPEQIKAWLAKADDPAGCPHCGAIAGCCASYPKCPGAEK